MKKQLHFGKFQCPFCKRPIASKKLLVAHYTWCKDNPENKQSKKLEPKMKCDAIILKRDQLRIGRGHGFKMHYRKEQCSREATTDGLCTQHAKMGGWKFNRPGKLWTNSGWIDCATIDFKSSRS